MTAKDANMDITTKNNRGKRRLAYIMGPSYSGSTLLTLLLADHPQMATVGELKASAMGDLTTYYCSCGEVLTDCHFWKTVQDKMSAAGHDFTFDKFKTHFRALKNPFVDLLLRSTIRGPLFETMRAIGFLFSSAAQETRQAIILQNQRLIDIICNLQQAENFLDDSKEPIRLQYLLKANLWDIRTIHLIRDGRGVANSYMRHNKTTMSEAARQWLHNQRECDRMARLLGNSRCLTVYYEDLCQEPAGTLLSIYNYLNLTTETISSPRTKHIMGNQMRLGSLKDIRLDEKWKHALSVDDLEIFNQTAGELNHHHGYQ